MSQVRRRRALRSSVLAASLAVLASLVVAPPAAAEDAPVTTTAPTTSAAAPTEDGAPTTSAPTTPGTPSEAPSTSGAGPSSDASAGAPTTPEVEPTADPDPGTPAPGDTVVGELQQAWPDPTAEEHGHDGHDGHDGHADESPLSWIDTGDGSAVRVPTDALPDVPVGSTIAVTVGEQVTDEASAEQGFAPAVDVQAVTVLDAATPDPTSASAGSAPTNTVTAVLVQPAGVAADSTTIASVVDTLNGAVSSFWNEQSDGTVRIQAVAGASGWVSSTSGCDAPFALWADVARQVGWTDGPGKHLMLYVPRGAAGCAYGLGTVGSSIGSGGLSYVQATKLSVMGHELGHNFGLGHSSELQCNSSLESGTCRTRDYYDFYDIMGISWDQVGTLNAVQAARLGLLPPAERVAMTTASAPTTVALAPVSAASGTRAIRLTASNGTVYYLEYRQAGGRDAWLGDARNQYGLASGVVLRRATSGGDTSLLLDGTPSPSAGWAGDMQQTLPVGATVPVAGGTYQVTVLATSATSATVRVGRLASVPVGSLDWATVSGGSVTVAGWMLDPDQVATSGQVHVYVDGVPVGAVTASRGRSDIAALFPGAGSAHGYEWSGPVSPGTHTICTYGIDVAEGPGNSLLGCVVRTRTAAIPVGTFEVATIASGTLTVSGWMLDPDQMATSGQVHVYVDGIPVGAVTAANGRPDVAARFPGAGAAHGYEWSGAVSPGTHVICVYGIDVVDGPGNSLLGCAVRTRVVSIPVGTFEVATIASGTLTVSGWMLDPDQMATSGQVHVYVDGIPVGAVTAGRGRADVATRFPGAGAAHGYEWSGPVAYGAHVICVYGIDVAEGPGNSLLGCAARTYTPSVPVGSVDWASLSGGTLTVSGWVVDPDAPGTSTDVHVYVDGRPVAVADAEDRLTDATQLAVQRLVPSAGPQLGYTTSRAVGPGPHTVCVYGIDVAAGPGNSLLGCSTLSGSGSVPVGGFEEAGDVGMDPSTFRLTGWVLDPDAEATSTSVHLYLDGVPVAVQQADRTTTAVPAVFSAAGQAHGFDVTLTSLSSAPHVVCAYGIDLADGPGNSLLGCHRVN